MTGTVHLSSAAGRSGRGQSPRRGVFARLGQIVTAHPGKVALGWLLIVGALFGLSSVLGQLSPSASVAAQLPPGYESARAQAAMDRAFGAPSRDATAVLVISRADGRPLTGGDLAAASRAAGCGTELNGGHDEAPWSGVVVWLTPPGPRHAGSRPGPASEPRAGAGDRAPVLLVRRSTFSIRGCPSGPGPEAREAGTTPRSPGRG